MRLLFLAQCVVERLAAGESFVKLEYLHRRDIPTLIRNIAWLVDSLKVPKTLKNVKIVHHRDGSAEIWPKSSPSPVATTGN